VTEEKSEAFEGKETKPFDPVQFLFANGRKIALRTFFLLIIAAPFLIFFGKTSYEATGILQIAPTAPTLLKSDVGRGNGTTYRSYVATQVSRLQQHELLMAALNRLPLSLKVNFVDENESLLEAAIGLNDKILVRQISNTHLIALSIRKIRPDGLAEMINSILAVYLEKLQEEEQGLDNRLLTYLRQEKKRTDIEITQLSKNTLQVALELGVATFADAESYIQSKHVSMQQQYLNARTASLQALKNLEGLQGKAEKLKAMPIELLIQEELNQTPSYSERKSFTYSTIQALTASLDAFADNNPTTNKVQQRIEEVQEQFDSLESSMKEEVTILVRERIDFQIQQEILEAENQHEIFLSIEEELKGELEKSSIELTQLSRKIIEGQKFNESLETAKTLSINLEQRIYQLTVEGKAPGRTTLEGIARAIEVSNLKKISILTVMGSAFLAGLFTLLVEVRDRKIRNRSHAVSALGSVPSWPVPYARDELGTDVPFSRVTLEAPNSTASKAIHSLAVKLDKDRKKKGGKIALFTGIGRKAGTTRICLNTAHAMKQTCTKVLLIDFNRQHPALHDFVPVTKSGKSNSLQDLITHDPERNLDLLTNSKGGAISDLSRNEILDLLQETRKQYDYVCIDSAPLTESDLTEFLAGQCDVTVPITCANHSDYNDTCQTIQILLRLEVTAIAPLLNWRAPSMTEQHRASIALLPSRLRNYLLRRRVRREEKKIKQPSEES